MAIGASIAMTTAQTNQGNDEAHDSDGASRASCRVRVFRSIGVVCMALIQTIAMRRRWCVPAFATSPSVVADIPAEKGDSSQLTGTEFPCGGEHSLALGVAWNLDRRVWPLTS